MIAQATFDLLSRYGRVFRASWKLRKDLEPKRRGALEREFLPAALELQESPPHPAPRLISGLILAAFAIALAWASLGRLDTVAVATGKVIPSTRAQVIQPIETAEVRAIHVQDGQRVEAGDLLVELDATTATADAAQAQEAWGAERLREARSAALIDAIESGKRPRLPAIDDVPQAAWQREAALLARQYREIESRLQALDAEQARAKAESRATEELVAKLDATLPIVSQRAKDYKNLVDQAFVSQHGYLEREQLRIETERDLAFQRAHLTELREAAREVAARKTAARAEAIRAFSAERVEAAQRMASLAAELSRTDKRQRLTRLTAPVAGTVQQLAIHTRGGIVTPAQPLLTIVPDDYAAEVEAVLENKDVGFVKQGQIAEIKVETFPFTRYGTIPAEVVFVSNDAVQDEDRGLVFPVRLKLERSSLQVDERTVNLTPGMAITAEIKTGSQRVIEYFLSPVLTTIDESLQER